VATNELIELAIVNRHLIEFVYQGKHRVVEPHVLGSRRGETGLLAYQIRGESRSGGLPQWRRFVVDLISGVNVLDEGFLSRAEAQRSGFDQVIAWVAPQG